MVNLKKEDYSYLKHIDTVLKVVEHEDIENNKAIQYTEWLNKISFKV